MEETVVTRQLTIKDMIASIRKAMKKECKSLSVRNAKGWVKIEGSWLLQMILKHNVSRTRRIISFALYYNFQNTEPVHHCLSSSEFRIK